MKKISFSLLLVLAVTQRLSAEELQPMQRKVVNEMRAALLNQSQSPKAFEKLSRMLKGEIDYLGNERTTKDATTELIAKEILFADLTIKNNLKVADAEVVTAKETLENDLKKLKIKGKTLEQKMANAAAEKAKADKKIAGLQKEGKKIPTSLLAWSTNLDLNSRIAQEYQKNQQDRLDLPAKLEQRFGEVKKQLLFQGALLGNEEGVKTLLDAGVRADTKYEGDNILAYLIRETDDDEFDPSMFKLLVDRGADVNASDEEGRTPLSYAASMRNEDAFKILLEQGADPKVLDFDDLDEEFKVILDELESKKFSDVKQALKKADPNAEGKVLQDVADRLAKMEPGAERDELVKFIVKDSDANKVFLDAVKNGHTNIVNLFLEDPGFDPNKAIDPTTGRNGLHYAALEGNDDMAKLMLKNWVATGLKDKKGGDTPLEIRQKGKGKNKKSGIGDIIRKEVRNRRRFRDVQDHFGVYAEGKQGRRRERKPEYIQEFFKNNPDMLDRPGPNGKTLLQDVVEKGDVDSAKFLLDQGADPDVQDKTGKSASMLIEESSNEKLKTMFAITMQERAPVLSEDPPDYSPRRAAEPTYEQAEDMFRTVATSESASDKEKTFEERVQDAVRTNDEEAFKRLVTPENTDQVKEIIRNERRALAKSIRTPEVQEGLTEEPAYIANMNERYDNFNKAVDVAVKAYEKVAAKEKKKKRKFFDVFKPKDTLSDELKAAIISANIAEIERLTTPENKKAVVKEIDKQLGDKVFSEDLYQLSVKMTDELKAEKKKPKREVTAMDRTKAMQAASSSGKKRRLPSLPSLPSLPKRPRLGSKKVKEPLFEEVEPRRTPVPESAEDRPTGSRWPVTPTKPDLRKPQQAPPSLDIDDDLGAARRASQVGF
ncbi:MAG: ankyrin repeat domain-containing protein [Epsilonproteobacteria bacterium]|nr:ankyrin repeat domain-containing protein [Campylobacterota bacterium]